MATRHQSPKMRGQLPHDIRPYDGAIYAPDLASRPSECRCVWVPTWTPLTTVSSHMGPLTATVTGYKPTGWIRKFTDRACPVIRHLA